jgi:hypothetical protein
MTDLPSLSKASVLPVKGSADGDLYNYVVNVTVKYSNQMKPDFSDIRFAVNNVEVSYYKINFVEGISADFYVQIPKLPQFPEITNIAIFSGSPVLADISSTDIFGDDLFDDFVGTSLDMDKWEVERIGDDDITVLDSVVNLFENTIRSKRLFLSASVTMKAKGIGVVGLYSSAGNGGWVGFFSEGNYMAYSYNPLAETIEEYKYSELDTHVLYVEDEYHIFRFDYFQKEGTALTDDGGTYILNNSYQVKFYMDGVYVGEAHNILWGPNPVPDGSFILTINKGNVAWVRVQDIIMSSPVLGEQTNWITNADISITDENGNSMNTVLVESLYPNDNSRDQIINLGSTLHDLKNVTIKAVPLLGDNIPDSMVSASADSYQYVELSLDKQNYYKTLKVPEIKAFTTQLLYMRCTIPEYSYDGPFMCGIEITAESG